jgi:acetolactate synthase regulatory subunit
VGGDWYYAHFDYTPIGWCRRVAFFFNYELRSHQPAAGGFFFVRNLCRKEPIMTWKFHIRAADQRRLFSRILQILESQTVTICSFIGETGQAGIYVTVVVASEQDKAYRIEALLCRLEDVREVSVLSVM